LTDSIRSIWCRLRRGDGPAEIDFGIRHHSGRLYGWSTGDVETFRQSVLTPPRAGLMLRRPLTRKGFSPRRSLTAK
jgi:hypothetical protein